MPFGLVSKEMFAAGESVELDAESMWPKPARSNRSLATAFG